MKCTNCGAHTEFMHDGRCYSCVISKRNKESPFTSSLPEWFIHFSNKILPPLFLLLIAVISLHYLPQVSSTALRINLGIISITASALGVYLVMLML